MKRLVARVLTAAALIAVAAGSSQAAHADSKSDCVWDGVSYNCTTKISQQGTTASGAPTSGAGTGTLTAGPTICRLDSKEVPVPCSNKYGTFTNSTQCTGYVQLADDQPAPPPGEVAGGGAWYACTLACEALGNADPLCGFAGISGIDYWSKIPPPRVQRYTPAQAAAVLARTFRLDPVRIGMAPARKVHADDPAGTGPYRRTWVGIPVWLWVADPTPLTYGPYQQTATLGGVTVTARATVAQIDWSTGDGQHVTCGAGTAFDPAAWAGRAAAQSPTCGLEFQHTSTAQPGGAWTVSAVSHWTVAWTGDGQNGTIDLTNLTANTPVTVGELQSVNVPVTPSLVSGR